MKRADFISYEGGRPYIFISYAHKDCDKVIPVLEDLNRRRYRVWYDDGIEPGSEWPENIAEHLNRCEVFVAFISPQAMASRNCRREVTYALSKEKPFLGVFLEKTEMTPGMEMQLSAQQCILAYNFRNTEDFVNKLVGSTLLEPCREIPEKAEETAKREQDQAEAGGQETKSPKRTTKSLMKEKEKDTDPRKKNLLKWMIPVVLFLVVISPNPLIPTSISVIFALIYFIIVRSAKKRVDQMIAKNQEDPDLFPAGSARRPDEPETDKESLC